MNHISFWLFSDVNPSKRVQYILPPSPTEDNERDLAGLDDSEHHYIHDNSQSGWFGHDYVKTMLMGGLG